MSDTSYSSQTAAIETVTVGSEEIVFRTTSEESGGALVSLDLARRDWSGHHRRTAAGSRGHGIEITRRVGVVA